MRLSFDRHGKGCLPILEFQRQSQKLRPVAAMITASACELDFLSFGAVSFVKHFPKLDRIDADCDGDKAACVLSSDGQAARRRSG